MTTACCEQLTFWDLGQQQVTVDFQGGCLVTDAGLLAIRALDKELGILAGLAERLPDPRAQQLVVHSREAILTQQVYQILAGYADCHDAQLLRHDPLFQTVVDVSPSGEQPLASGSTLARFQHAYTRRQAEQPPEEREVLGEVDAAQSQRVKILNDYLPELFIRTRRQVPTALTIDLDASDDPTHGQQILTGFHGYFDQHQYFPLYAFDGDTGFPLAAWLRPGTVHASCGAVDTLRTIVGHLAVSRPVGAGRAGPAPVRGGCACRGPRRATSPGGAAHVSAREVAQGSLGLSAEKDRAARPKNGPPGRLNQVVRPKSVQAAPYHIQNQIRGADA